MFFARNGHVAKTTPDGLEALRIIARDREELDLIILDYHMPGMTGLEVASHLRQMEDVSAIPIILFTGDVHGDFEDEVRELGIACVIYKPIEPQKLITTAQSLIETHRA